MLALYLIAAICVAAVTGHPDGAPLDSCDTMTPVHGTFVPQTTASPFTIDLSINQMVTNAYIKVTLTSTDNTPFQGFLLKGLPKNVTTGFAGEFANIGSTDYQFLGCSGIPQSAITHVAPTNKTSIVTGWTSPNLGTYNLVASVAQDYETFWVKIYSEDIFVHPPS